MKVIMTVGTSNNPCLGGDKNDYTYAKQSILQGGSVNYGAGHDDWKMRLKNHDDATTFASGELKSIAYKPGKILGGIDCSKSGGLNITGDQIDGCLCPVYLRYANTPSSGSVDVDADNRAKRAFLRDLINAKTRFQSLVALGEFGENLRMANGAAMSLQEAIREWKNRTYFQHFKKGMPGRGKLNVALTAITSSWLEFSFGWQPAANDIRNYLVAAQSLLNDQGQFKGTYLRAKGNSTSISTAHRKYSCGVYKTSVSEVEQVDRTVIYRGWYEGSPVSMPDEMTAFGLTLEEIPMAIYDLTPWTWLLDYFVNVGDVINALSYWRSGLRWTNKTVRHRGRVYHANCQVEPSPGFESWGARVDSFTPHTFHSKYLRWTRGPYTGTFVPELTFQIPGLDTRWANVASLAWLKSWKPYKFRSI
jgi:hypothetical protein